MSEETLDSTGFASTIPWEDQTADCLVICCSDHRFRSQNIEFIKRLGYRCPHVISLPSGVGIAHGRAAASEFLPKAVKRLLAKAAELTGASDLICIAHEDCGGYRSGRVKLIGKVSRRLTHKSIGEIQREHLQAAARSIRHSLPDTNVRTFYAELFEEGGETRVRYKEIALPRGRRSSRGMKA